MYIRKRGNRFSAEVKIGAIRKTKTFATKTEARAWAIETESNLNKIKDGHIPAIPFAELIDRYINEVTVKKRSARWEKYRLNKIKGYPIGKVLLENLKPSHATAWREARLREVSGATVAREMNILSHVCNTAVNEWGWLHNNPFSRVSAPSRPPHRDRRINDEEIEKLMIALGYDETLPVSTVGHRVAVAFLFALETAMRAGEIASLTARTVDFKKRVATLMETKNGYSRRVPLSRRAIELLERLPDTDGPLFGLSADALSTQFRKARDRTDIEDLHFHDTRHEAITRLAKKIGVLDLARMVGHRDIRMLQIYYNATAEDIAKELD